MHSSNLIRGGVLTHWIVVVIVTKMAYCFWSVKEGVTYTTKAIIVEFTNFLFKRACRVLNCNELFR